MPVAVDNGFMPFEAAHCKAVILYNFNYKILSIERGVRA